MKEKEPLRNPVIRVLPDTRRKLKSIAAHYGMSMMELVEKLADAEFEHIHRQIIDQLHRDTLERAQRERQQREEERQGHDTQSL